MKRSSYFEDDPQDRPRPRRWAGYILGGALALAAVGGYYLDNKAEQAANDKKLGWAVAEAYNKGYTEGHDAASMVMPKAAPALEPKAAPASPLRGPLDLSLLRSYGATGKVACYTWEGPDGRRIELPPRDQQGRVVDEHDVLGLERIQKP